MKRIFSIKYKGNISLLLFVFIIVSCEEILLEYDISEDEVNLLAPSNDAVINASEISFRWEFINGATEYEIQIADPDFDDPNQIVVSELTQDNFFNFSLPEGDYEWRLRGVNSNYHTPFSRNSFTVKNDQEFSARRVNLIMPSDDLITNQYAQRFKWDTISGASVYRFQLISDGVVVDEQATSSSSVNLNLPNGSFEWKVRAESNTQNTFYSERNILIDTISPNRPQLLKPEDSLSLSNNTVNFEWDDSGTNTEMLSSEIDSIYVYKDMDLQEEVLRAEGINKAYSEILDRNETYYWFVISFDLAGNRSEESEVRSFKIE